MEKDNSHAKEGDQNSANIYEGEDPKDQPKKSGLEEKDITQLLNEMEDEKIDDEIDSLLNNIQNTSEQLEGDFDSSVIGGPTDSDARSVYIDNVHFSATKEEVEELFRPCGDILRVSILNDARTRRSRGKAYVEFKPQNAQDLGATKSVGKALLLDQTLFKGRPITVTRKRATHRPAMMPGMGDSSHVGRPTYRGRPSFRGAFRGRGRGGRRY